MPAVVKMDTDDGFAWPVIDLDRGLLLWALRRCEDAGVGYRLGAKPPSLNAAPGKDFARIDCSGFFRWLVWQAGQTAVPDGSWVQRQWLEDHGFKRSTVDAGFARDGVVRVAVLPQLRAFGFVGHIALVINGATIESAGGRGPCRREWDGRGWQARSVVFVLDLAPG